MIIPTIADNQYVEFRQSLIHKEVGLKQSWKNKEGTALCLVNNPPQWSEGNLRRSSGLCPRFLQQG